MIKDLRKYLKQIWNFLWNDDSLLSWVVNIVLAFILIKFIVYPGLGFVFATTHPVVAVVSGSMEHKTSPVCIGDDKNSIGCDKYNYVLCGNNYNEKNRVNLDFFWKDCGGWYEREEIGISKEEFNSFKFKNGFNKGDIMVLRGKGIKDITVGDVVVFQSGKPDPIIHRVVKKFDVNGVTKIQTKGDHNIDSLENVLIDETSITEKQVVGTALFRIPLLGYIKIGFVKGICFKPVKKTINLFYKNLRCGI